MADHTLLAHDASPILHGSEDAYEEMVILFEEGSRVRIETRRAAAVRSKDECSYRVIAVRLASAREGTCCVDLELLREDLADGGFLSDAIEDIVKGFIVQPIRHGHYIGSLTQEASEALDRVGVESYTGEPAPWADRRGHHVEAFDYDMPALEAAYA